MPGERHRLTATSLARLEPRESLYTVWDDEVRGLLVQVTPKGVRSWFVDFTDKTTRRRSRRKIGDVAVLSPKEARDRARAVLGDVAHGKQPFEATDRARDAGTFRKAAEDYLAAYEGIHARNTINTRKTGLKVHASAEFGGRPLLAVTKEDVRKLHARLAPKQPVTANRIVQAIRLLYRWCAETGRVPEGFDPTRGVKLASEPKRHRVFSPDEYARIADALDAEQVDNGTALAACECLRFILLTGRRRDEARTLRWVNVDLDEGTMRGIKTKTGVQSFAIPEAALEVLRRQDNRKVISAYVFASPVDKRKPVVNVNLVWDRVKVRAGIKGEARIHDMRHSVGGSATAAGVPIQSVGQLLGHRSMNATARYAGAHEDHARGIAEMVSAAIAESMRGAT